MHVTDEDVPGGYLRSRIREVSEGTSKEQSSTAFCLAGWLSAPRGVAVAHVLIESGEGREVTISWEVLNCLFWSCLRGTNGKERRGGLMQGKPTMCLKEKGTSFHAFLSKK